jgi:2-succinyl-6-hydroxy-2,4-cyclohexadiene-1-carboxylate synthase
MAVQSVNGVKIHYDQAGSGDTIVFLHGFTGSHRDWAYQKAFLSDTYRLIAVDFRGHGNSEAPDAEDAYTIKLFSEDVYALLSTLGIEGCCLVGHSMGGFTALQFVLDHPEMVRALVLVDTSSGDFETVTGYEQLRARLDDLALNVGLEAAFEYDAVNNPVRIERFRKHPEWKDVARRKVLSTSVAGYIYTPRAFGKWKAVTGRLSEIGIPTLIFCGQDDTPFLKASQVLRNSIKDSELVVVPDAGHSPHEEAPEFFNRHLKSFLDSINRQQGR